MMMNTNPTAADIDAAINLLSILELAKDATQLKDALKDIKKAQDAAAAERKKADKSLADLKAKFAELDEQTAVIEQERAKLAIETARTLQASKDVDDMRVAMREQRIDFDRWMAQQREKLAADEARVASDSVANARRAEDLKTLEDEAARRADRADAAKAAADAKREEFEAKLENLKQMIS
jgi:chromosome segregation ATPase